MSSVTYKGAVYPWQCDHIGHMNVMWYVGKFDEANWNFFARLGLTPTYFAEQHRGMAAVQQNIAHKHELLAGNIVEVRSRALEDRAVADVEAGPGRETEQIDAPSSDILTHLPGLDMKTSLPQFVVQLGMDQVDLP
jgi:acyl-CoA thioester hydrolase